MLGLVPGGFLKKVQEDTSPVLGGDLDGGGHDITNLGAGACSSLAVNTSTLAANLTGYEGKVGIRTVTALSRFDVNFDEIPADIRGRGNLQEFYGHANYLKGNVMLVARGTKASPTVVGVGDLGGALNALFYDGSKWRLGGSVFSVVSAVSANNNVATELHFYTGTVSGDATTGASTGLTKQMILNKTGDLIIGDTVLSNPGGWGRVVQAADNASAAFSVHDKSGGKQFDYGVSGTKLYLAFDADASAHRMVIDTNGYGGFGTINPIAQWHVDQASAAGAIPVLLLDQADVDHTFIDFVGAYAVDGSRSISMDTTEDSAKYCAFKIEINGITKWIRVYDDHS